MKHYRRFFTLVLAGALLLACAACGATSEYEAIEIDSALEQYIEEVAQEHYVYPVYQPGFLITAIKIHGAYQRKSTIKVFVSTWHSAYNVVDDSAQAFSSGHVPVAITCRKEADGTYRLIEYKFPKMDGAFSPSVRAFCKLPSGQNLNEVAEEIFDCYQDPSELDKIHQQKRDAYLAEHGLRLFPPEWANSLPEEQTTNSYPAEQRTKPVA